MAQPLTPAQTNALKNLHQALEALATQEGKGGPTLVGLVNAVNAELVSEYKSLLGIPAK